MMKGCKKGVLFAFVCFCLVSASSGQALLLADINAGSVGSFPFSYEEHNGKLYFGADDGFRGYELWSYDGSAISIASDISFGASSSFPIGMTSYNGKLYFKASLTASGPELWSFDGTTATLVEDVISGAIGSNPSDLTVFDGKLYFRASNAASGTELYSFDGTSVQLAADIVPGTGSSFISNLAVYGSDLYFQASDASFDLELWKFDGTSASKVGDINASGPSAPSNLIVYNNILYFSAYDGGSAGEELWSYDGTSLQIASNIAGGAASSSPEYLILFQNELYFTANDGVNGREWWSFDGNGSTRRTTFSGTADAQMNSPAVLNNKLYFAAHISVGNGNSELWSFDGTNRALEADINSGATGSEPSGLVEFGNKLVFDADDGVKGRELWSFDPDCSPTAVCKDDTLSLAADGNGTLTASIVDGGSTANCGVLAIQVNNSSFNCSNLGVNQVVLTITDLAFNSSQCTADITVADYLPPTAVCQDITAILTVNNTANIVAAQLDGGSFDNCAMGPLTIDQAAFSLADVGTNTVILTTSDVSGNTSTCTSEVSVSGLKVDAGIATLLCRGSTHVLGGSPTAEDGLEPYSYVWNPESNLDDPAAANPVFSGSQTKTYTLSVTDAAGISRSSTVRINVASVPSADAGENGLICTGERVSIGGSPSASGGQTPYDYLWSPSTGLQDPTRNSTSAGPSETTVYTLLVTDDNSCTASSAVTVAVGGAPLANFSISDQNKLSNLSGNVPFEIRRKHFFGRSVTSLGDLNNDGIGDLAVGVPLDDENRNRTGAVQILFMNAGGTVASSQKIGSVQGNLPFTLNKKDEFGTSVANLGDVNQDGITDLLVGAPGDDQSARDGGALYVLFLNTDGTVLGGDKVTVFSPGFTGVLDKKDEFGTSCAAVGDFDGDGVPDAIAGAPFDDEVNKNSGTAWLLLLNVDGSVKSTFKISNVAFGQPFPIDGKSSFGHGLTAIGDADGNGVTDFAIGAPFSNDGGTRKGAVWIVFMNQNGTVRSKQKISETGGGFACNLDPKVFFGFAVSSIGDYNGDGVEDIVVGSPGDSDGGRSKGAVWTLYLKSNGFIEAASKISETSGGFTGVLDDKDKFGSSVANIGDIDGDGNIDIAVGAPENDDLNLISGAVWILQSNNVAPKLSIPESSVSAEDFERYAVSGLVSESGWVLYPNPTSSKISLACGIAECERFEQAELINLQGQSIARAIFNRDQLEFDLSDLADGVYVVRLTAEGKNATLKFVLTRN